MDKAPERYLKRLGRALVCPKVDRERFLKDARDMLENFSQENPGAFYQTYEDAFGPPEVFAAEMLSSVDPENVVEARERKRRTLVAIGIVIATLLVLLAGFWFGRRTRPPVEPAPTPEAVTPTPEATPTPTPEVTPTPDPTAEPTPAESEPPAPSEDPTAEPISPETEPSVPAEVTAGTYLESLYLDADAITHREAVAVLTKLGLMSGNDEGEFHPGNTVTRAECAKLIALIMMGGTDYNTGVKDEPSFSDIQGWWAESYIEYCSDMGIVFPDNEGRFRPGDNITGIELVRMALCALGYNADAYRLRENDWAIRTDELARILSPSLYEDLAGVVMAGPITREEAAQILCTTLRSTPKRVVPYHNTEDGTITWQYVDSVRLDGTPATLLWERFNLTLEDITFD